MKPKYYWYGIVKKQIMQSPYVIEHSLQSTIIANAMKDANKETMNLPNGKLRLKAVKDILIDKRSTYEGVGMELGYEWHTVQSWINSYVNLVGKKAGY